VEEEKPRGAGRRSLGRMMTHKKSMALLINKTRLFLPTPPYLLVPRHTKYENTILSFFFHPLEFEIISLWIM